MKTNKIPQEQTALLSDELDPSDLAAVVAGTTSFATDLYAHLAHRAPCFFFSPASISLALAMTSAGAPEPAYLLGLPPGALPQRFALIFAPGNRSPLALHGCGAFTQEPPHRKSGTAVAESQNDLLDWTGAD